MEERDKNVSIINEGCTLEGTFDFTGYVMIAGTIKGTLTAESVMAEQKSHIKADSRAEFFTIAGTYEGTLEITGTLTLLETARVTAQIRCNKLIVKQGCIINGKIGPLAD